MNVKATITIDVAHEYNTVSQSVEFDNQKIEFMAGDESFFIVYPFRLITAADIMK